LIHAQETCCIEQPLAQFMTRLSNCLSMQCVAVAVLQRSCYRRAVRACGAPAWQDRGRGVGVGRRQICASVQMQQAN